MNDNNEEDIYKVDDDDDYVIKEEKKNDLGAKLTKYGIITFIALIILVLLIAIFSPKQSTKKDVVTKEITLNAGDKYTIDYSKGTYTWTSSDQGVAKVSDDGEIIALKNGETTVTIKAGSETVTYKVRVDNLDDSIIVTNVKMEKNTIELEKDKTYDMKVEFTPSNVKNVELTWTSSDENVVTVKGGTIKAIAPGTSMVTVMTPNGNIDYCLVKVLGDGKYNPIESITIKSTDVTLNKGTSYNLSYEVLPSESVNLVEWESSNPEVATVENGVIYALASGEVDITAKSGAIEKTINVKVNGETAAPKVVLNYNSLGLKVGEFFNLVVDNDVEVEWISSDSNIVTVDQDGEIYAKGVGEATITAKTEDGFFDECSVVVSEQEVYDKITLNTNSLSLNVGNTARLTATVTPSNNVSEVTWTSSNTNVVTVSNGDIIAKANGTATITAKLPNGEKADCIVTVSTKVVNVLQVQINVSDITLNVNGTAQLSAKVLPSTATNKTITWSSSNTSIATVDKNGKVTAHKKGSAKIYAKASNGVFDVCGVVVK